MEEVTEVVAKKEAADKKEEAEETEVVAAEEVVTEAEIIAVETLKKETTDVVATSSCIHL